MTRVDPAALLARLGALEQQLATALAEREQAARDREQAERERNQAVTDRDYYQQLYLRALEQCRKLELGLAGPKSERSSPADAQLAMAILTGLVVAETTEPEPDDDDAAAGTGDPPGRPARKKPTGRRPLPADLPRIDIELVPPEVERDGRDAYEVIGVEVTETVERRRASLVVVRTSRPKFVRKDRERNAETEVVIAPPLEQLPIARGLAGPGLLADSIVRRWQDHLPLHRLESVYAREGLDLDRSTLCTWHQQLSQLVAPLIVAMWRDALASPYLCTDSTGVPVQAKDKCRTGHFWAVIAPERHVLFGYSTKNDSEAVDRLLRGYRGMLVADAHAVYDHLYRTGEVIEVGCWAHARRYFFKAVDSEPQRAAEALAMINALFALERSCAGAPPGKRRSVRKEKSKALVERFFAWCDSQVDHVLDDTPIARAVGYARNQRAALSRFLDDERLPIDNNISERALRREVVGRKNWLFLGNDDAGVVNTAFVSLLASCQLHGIEPWAYLRDLFCLLPDWPVQRLLELSPAFWHKTREQHETQLLLDSNVFRRASLDPGPSHRPQQ